MEMPARSGYTVTMSTFFFEFQPDGVNSHVGSPWSEFHVEADTESAAWREANRLKPNNRTLRPKKTEPIVEK
jgi:hypothetical protein